jgi:GDPmannose 4,6-dehydratase
MARILVTGVAGQIGSFLAERLIAGGHHVIGVEHGAPRSPVPAEVDLRVGELDASGVEALLDSCGALDAIVHFAGKTSVAESWKAPMATFDANARMTAALAFAAQARGVTFVNASSAEIFGATTEPIQDEATRLAPVSPYGVGKASGHLTVQLTRESMGARATNLIFFLGESPRRPPHIVFRKITRGLARVKLGREDSISLGNVSVIRDFCYADDYARAAEMAATGALPPGDYVCASGEPHSVADIATTACRIFGLDPARVVTTDPSLFRTADIPRLVGDASKIRAHGWAPSKTFEQLVRHIAEYDLGLETETT